MRNIFQKIQNLMTAVTFAEAGEWEIAKEFLPESELSREPSRLNRVFMAIAFAEAGLHDEALRIAESAPAKNKEFAIVPAAEPCLKGVRLVYGTVSL